MTPVGRIVVQSKLLKRDLLLFHVACHWQPLGTT